MESKLGEGRHENMREIRAIKMVFQVSHLDTSVGQGIVQIGKLSGGAHSVKKAGSGQRGDARNLVYGGVHLFIINDNFWCLFCDKELHR